jgi:predicted dehydrogenase
MEVPQRFYPPGGHPRETWRSMFYANLIRDFNDEILGVVKRNQGNFRDGAWVQEVISAVKKSVRENRWVSLPLER